MAITVVYTFVDVKTQLENKKIIRIKSKNDFEQYFDRLTQNIAMAGGSIK